MKFEKVRMHFKSGVFSLSCHPEILLTWQRDVTAFPLYLPRQTLEGDHFYLKMKKKTLTKAVMEKNDAQTLLLGCVQQRQM